MRFDGEPMFKMDYEDSGGFDPSFITPLSTQSGLSALTPPPDYANNVNNVFQNVAEPIVNSNNLGFSPARSLASEYNNYNYEDSMAGGLPAVSPQPVQPPEPVYTPPAPVYTQPAPIEQPVEPAKPDYIDSLSKQILGQGMTDKWTGQGFGSAEANARDMAKILAGIGITDISQFGPITEQVQEIIGYDDSGNPIYDTQTRNTFGNKLTGQAVPLTYSGRQTGNFFGGTYEGKGNTGYGVQFDEQGNPFFYTQGASSSDVGKLAPLLAMAQFIPALAPFATAANAAIAASQGNVLGAIAGAAGLGGYSDIANAANFAGAVKSGNPLSIISSGANLGGMDLSGAANAAGLNDLNKIGGFNLNDIAKTYQTAKALKSGDPASIISALGGYVVGQGNQTPSSPIDSLEPFPAEPISVGEDPVSTSIFNRPIDSSIDIDPTDTPRIAFNPMDLYQELPKSTQQTPAVDQRPDMSGKSFNSAFAQARASGAKEFLWEGNVYNTNLAPTANKMNAGPRSTRTIETGAGMSPEALAGWGGSKVDPNFIKAAAPYLGWDPTTYFPKVDIKMSAPTAAYGNVPEYDYKPSEQSYLNIAPYLTKIGERAKEPGMAADVLTHELAHVGQKLASAPGEDPTKLLWRMAHQAGMNVLGSINRPDDVTKFNAELDKVLPYINQKYGQMSTGYINDATGKTTTNKYDPSSKLFEKLTDLAALEMQTGKDLTSDPYLRETLFKDPKAVAMYNAMTIPRMSRLDPRDLPPGRVTTSDFPKGQVPLGFRVRNALRGGGGRAEGGLASLNKSGEQ